MSLYYSKERPRKNDLVKHAVNDELFLVQDIVSLYFDLPDIWIEVSAGTYRNPEAFILVRRNAKKWMTWI